MSKWHSLKGCTSPDMKVSLLLLREDASSQWILPHLILSEKELKTTDQSTVCLQTEQLQQPDTQTSRLKNVDG